MFKCLYIAGHVFLVQGDTAVNLNNITEVRIGDPAITSERGKMVFGYSRGQESLVIDAPVYEMLETRDRQATQKPMGEQ